MQPLRDLVLYEDEDLLVLNKPPGLISDQTETQSEKTLVDYLINDFKIPLERGGLVHRLDKDTSGVLIVAKTQKALENLQSQFKERKIKKEYLALVHGEMKEPRVVEGAILRNPKTHDKFTVDEEGRESKTEFIPQKVFHCSDEFKKNLLSKLSKIEANKLRDFPYDVFTFLQCIPLTGRTHQIRVHLKYINFPILGDEKYVGKKAYKLDQLWCLRQFLHAYKIQFTHPQTGQEMKFEVPLPKDLEDVLNLLTQNG